MQLESIATCAGAAMCAMQRAIESEASGAACEVQYCFADHVYF
jgi:hypothetical protein